VDDESHYQEFDDPLASEEIVEADDIFSDDDSFFSLISVEISELKDIRRGWNNRAIALGTDETIIIDAENDLNLQENEELMDDDEEDDAKPTKGMSIAHKLIFKNRLVYLSFDIETGGAYCGIVQISCQKFQLTEHNNEISAEVEPVTFNKYVKPPSDAIWDTKMCRRVHGLHPEHENIRDADDIATVWNQFYEFIKSNSGRQQVGVLVAWNGVTCDMRWIHKLCQAPKSIFELPASIKYFMDPMSVIREYKGCKLNKKHSKIESYELGVVWSFIKKCNLGCKGTDRTIHAQFGLQDGT